MYDTKEKILERISLGEDSTIEFKEKLPQRDDLADEIAAFANSKGGVILIGVTDKKKIIGVDNLDQVEKTVLEVCQDSIKPPLSVHTNKLRIENKNVLKVEVPHSFFVHESPHGCFRRDGSSKREMPQEELARLFQSRSQARIIRFDEQIMPNTSIDTLSQSLYKKFISDNLENDDTITALYKRRLLQKENGKNRASVAGVLMCCNTPTEHFYHSFIQAVLYRGKEKDAHYQIDAQDFKGPLNTQIVEAFKFVKKHNQVSAIKDIGRIEKPQYSMKAVFEAIVNAVVHRDYSKHGCHIRLFMFSDRLEIYSPGALANTLTVDTLSQNIATRNELLARLLSEIFLEDEMGRIVSRKHLLERRGEGVSIIINESKKLSGKEPIYELFGEELRLTIFAAKPISKKEV